MRDRLRMYIDKSFPFCFYQDIKRYTHTRTFTRTSSCRTKKGKKGRFLISHVVKGAVINLQTDQRGSKRTQRSLLVRGTRGGWRDGKSEVRVSGSWNRQGAKARLEARHWAPRGHWLPRFVALFRSTLAVEQGKARGKVRLLGASCCHLE